MIFKTFTHLFKVVFVVKKVKNKVPWTYVISDFNSGKTVEAFNEKKLQKLSQNEFRIENNQEKR